MSDPGYFRGTVVSKLGTLREPSSLQGLSLFLPSLFDPDRVRRRWWEMYVRDVPVARCTRDTTT
ncbi:MAG: hypothetical protein IRZ28_10445 [Steroidobacteraceae bacterium]|nr:hypothetical protein [Steroidobacteraceae bacterium]